MSRNVIKHITFFNPRRIYEWEISGTKVSFKYPPNWIVQKEYYSTPAQQASGEIPQNIGLFLIPEGGSNEGVDYIHMGGRQNCCEPNQKHTRCYIILSLFPV